MVSKDMAVKSGFWQIGEFCKGVELPRGRFVTNGSTPSRTYRLPKLSADKKHFKEAPFP